MQEPKVLLHDLQDQVKPLIWRRRWLNWLLWVPKTLVIAFVVLFAVFIGSVLSDHDALGGGLIFLIYGTVFAMGGAGMLVDYIAGLLKYPFANLRSLQLQIDSIESDIWRAERFIGLIDELKTLKKGTKDENELGTINSAIERLKDAVFNPADEYLDRYKLSEATSIKKQIESERNGSTELIRKVNEQTIRNKTNARRATSVGQPSKPRGEKTEVPPVAKVPVMPSASKPEPDPGPTQSLKPSPQVKAPSMADILRSGKLKKPGTIYEENKDQPSIETDIATIFNPQPRSIVKRISNIRKRAPSIKSMVNYLELYIKNQDVGRQGELFVLAAEREYLLKNNRKDLADQVEHVSLDRDWLGYDILSFDLNGGKKHIEVKTTLEGYRFPFFLSVNEMQMMGLLANYHIHRVYDFDRKSQTGLIYKVDCAKDFERYFRTETAVYKVIPNTH